MKVLSSGISFEGLKEEVSNLDSKIKSLYIKNLYDVNLLDQLIPFLFLVKFELDTVSPEKFNDEEYKEEFKNLFRKIVQIIEETDEEFPYTHLFKNFINHYL